MQMLRYSVDHWGAAGAELVRQLSVTTGTTRKQRKAAASGVWQLVKATERNLKLRQQLLSVAILTKADSGEQMVLVELVDAPPPKVVPTLTRGVPPLPRLSEEELFE